MDFVGKPSVGTGLGFGPDGNPVIEPDADLVVEGAEAANRWFAATWLKQNPHEASVMLAHTGPGVENATDSMGVMRLDGGAMDASALARATSEFSPYGWHMTTKLDRAGRASVTDIVVGGVEMDAAKFGPRFDEFRQALESEGFRVKSSTVEPARIEFLEQADAEGVIRGGPRGASPAAEGEVGDLAGEVGGGGPVGYGAERRAFGGEQHGVGGTGAYADDLRGAIPEPGAAPGVESRWAGPPIDIPDLSGRRPSSAVDKAIDLLASGQAPTKELVEELGPAVRVGTRTLGGGVAGAYEASQEEGATPGDIAKGFATGSVLGAGRAAGANRAGLRLGIRAAGIIDADGRILPKPSEVAKDLIIPGREAAPEVSQIAGPRGELLSTVTAPSRGVTGIARTAEGAEHIGEPSAATLARMPNLDYLGEGMDDIKQTLQALAEANAPMIDKYKRGTQSWDKLVEELAPRVGMSKAEFMNSRIGRGWNEAEMLALNAAHLDQTRIAQDFADEVAAAGGIGGLTPERKLKLAEELVDAGRLQMVAEGGASTMGRGLNQQKIRLTQAQASKIAGRNEEAAAKTRQATASRRAERAEGAAAKTASLVEERKAAVAEAQRITDRSRAKATAEAINKAYDDLARYQAMTLAEKDEVFQARLAERAAAEAKRAKALEGKDPAQELLDALKAELAAEEKHFGKNRESWMDMAFWADKKDEMMRGPMPWREGATAKNIPGPASIEGQKKWLEAQAKAARQEWQNADKQAQKAFGLESRLRERDTSQALKVLAELGTERITDDVLANYLKVQAKNDPLEMAKFLKGLRNVNWWQRANILRYAGMLSATVTHGVQAAGGALNLAAMPATTAIGAPIDALTSAVRGTERTRYGREIPEQLRGMYEGAIASKDDVWEVLKSGINTREVSKDIGRARTGFGAAQSASARAGLGAVYGGMAGAATAPEDAGWEERLKRGAIGAGVGAAGLAAARGQRAGQAIDIAAEGPLRLMQASDIAFRGAARGAQTRGIAYRTARNEGRVGEVLSARTDEIMRNLHEFPEIVDEADKAAARVVLQEERDAMKYSPTSAPGLLGEIASIPIPFARTPINIAAQGLGMTPLGVAGAIDAARKGQRGETIDRVARTMMGSAVMVYAGSAGRQRPHHHRLPRRRLGAFDAAQGLATVEREDPGWQGRNELHPVRPARSVWLSDCRGGHGRQCNPQERACQYRDAGQDRVRHREIRHRSDDAGRPQQHHQRRQRA